MHTIDLLRGEGIPAKATFGTVFLAGLIVAVPFLAASVMAGRYLQSREVIGINQDAVIRAEQTIEQHKADLAQKEQKERQQAAINARLAEVKTCLGEYIQWSPVLTALAENMPPGMVMSRLAAETRQSRLTTAVEEKGSSRPTNVTINKRVLILDLAGKAGGNYDGTVRQYGERLKSLPALASRLENVLHSQKPGDIGDAKTVIYTMELVFKAGT